MRRTLLVALLIAALAGTAAAAGPFPGTKSPKDRAAWRAILKWPVSCEHEWQMSSPDFAGISTWAAGARKLVMVDCFFGAYQGIQLIYLVDTAKRKVGPARLHLYIDTGNGKATPVYRTRVLGVANFDSKTRRLVVLDKGRGLGDCGFYSVFRLVGDRFVPVESRAKLACDGKGADPTRWPKLTTLKP
jgi:hypothetical protein